MPVGCPDLPSPLQSLLRVDLLAATYLQRHPDCSRHVCGSACAMMDGCSLTHSSAPSPASMATVGAGWRSSSVMVPTRPRSRRPPGTSSWRASGISFRRGLLLGAGIELPDDLGEAGAAGIDDVLDAAVVAWSSHWIALGEAESLPAQPVAGPDGIKAAIWY